MKERGGMVFVAAAFKWLAIAIAVAIIVAPGVAMLWYGWTPMP